MDRKEAEDAMEEEARKTIGGAVLGLRGQEGDYRVLLEPRKLERCVIEARVTVRYPEDMAGEEWLSEDGDMTHSWKRTLNQADGSACDLEHEIEHLGDVKGKCDEKTRAHLARHLVMACHLAERLDKLAGKLCDSSHECHADGIVKMKADYIIPPIKEDN